MFRLTVIAWLAAFAAGECEPGSAECKTEVDQDASVMKVSMLQKRSGATITQNTEEIVNSLEARKAAILAELEAVEEELAAKDEQEVTFEGEQEAATDEAEFEETSLQFAQVANMVAENMTGRPTFPCLCTYDVDRTLTGRQGKTDGSCKGNHVVAKVLDNKGYPPKTDHSYLTQSVGGLSLGTSYCSGCFQGIVSLGKVGGQSMQDSIRKMLPSRKGVDLFFSTWGHDKAGPLIRLCHDSKGKAVKPKCALKVMWWYNQYVLQCLNKDGSEIPKKKCLKPSDVYHFDDEKHNINAFSNTKDKLEHAINANQIGCTTMGQDPDTPKIISLCGGTVNDFKNFKKGHNFCNHKK